MKKLSETKRQAILDAATQVFREVGFERASMSEICARVGGSKATLYNYYPSKAKLFFEVMLRNTESDLDAIYSTLEPATKDVAATLRRYGEKVLDLAYSPEILAARRLSYAEAGRFDIGRMVYEGACVRAEDRVSAFLAEAMRRGLLRKTDPRVAANHLMALLEAELLQRLLYHLVDAVDAKTIRGIVRRAIEVFMGGYAAR
ncbi:MAG: TetR/AcrR family transcriptional regulator [Gammaproteobacteria bacterium]|nr:TetR/AcrR family transcriptional regulator [Gammaproteobacteria bacterium]